MDDLGAQRGFQGASDSLFGVLSARKMLSVKLSAKVVLAINIRIAENCI